MILINKKRLKIITSCILVSLLAFSFHIAGTENNLSEDSKIGESTIETTSTPVSGKTVVLDAGHGKPDERSRK